VRTGWRSDPGVNADDGVTYAANMVDVAAGGPALTGRFHVKQSGSVPHRFRLLGRFTHYGRLGPGGGGSERLMIKAFEWVRLLSTVVSGVNAVRGVPGRLAYDLPLPCHGTPSDNRLSRSFPGKGRMIGLRSRKSGALYCLGAPASGSLYGQVGAVGNALGAAPSTRMGRAILVRPMRPAGCETPFHVKHIRRTVTVTLRWSDSG
jgi:hypothetical protein